MINGTPWLSATGGWAFSANGHTYNPYTGGASYGVIPYVYLYGDTGSGAQANGVGSRMSLSVIEETAQATPLPAALPLFASGLGAMGLFGWRRKRKNAAALAAA